MISISKNIKSGCLLIIMISFFSGSEVLLSQNVNDMNKRAEEHYKKKEFNKAVALWLNILDIDPENLLVQRRIEAIYEEKQKKDFSLQRARLNYKIARKTLELNRHSEELTDEDIEKNLKIIVKRANSAFASFITAFRIDPNDSELFELREKMKQLEKEVKAEESKGRLSLRTRMKIRRIRDLANKKMAEKKFEEAILDWNAILAIVPLDTEAKEGKRKCSLAIENRLKYENIKRFLEQGKALYVAKKYKPSKIEFTQVLTLDPENREAEDYLELIAEKLEEQRMREVTRLQAEDFYVSGIRNLKKNNFDLAIEDFESCLALFANYKDAKARLRSVAALKEAYLKKRRQEDLKAIDREFQNGMVSLSDGKYREAISAFALTLSLDPSNKQAKKYMERARDAQNAVAEEIVDENSPYYGIVNSLIVAGRTLYMQGKYNESKKKWDNILTLFPKNRIASEYLLKCEYKLNPGGYQEFVKSIVAEGENFLKEKKYREALRRFELIKSINANYPGINRLVGQARNGLKGRKKKITIADRREIGRRYKRAINYFRIGGRNNLQKALNDFRWVVANDNENVKAIVSVNKIETMLRISGKTVGVKRIRLTAKQRQQARKHYYLGINYYSNNDFKKAIKEWKKVLEIDPQNKKAKNNIRKCLAFLGR